MRGIDPATILSPSFHGVRNEHLKNCVGVCRFFASVFTINSAVEKTACIRSDTVISDVTLNESTVVAALKALEVSKATGPDEIAAKLLK